MPSCSQWWHFSSSIVYSTSPQLFHDPRRIWKLEFRAAARHYFPSVSHCFYICCHQKEIALSHFLFSLPASLGEWDVRDFNADKLRCYSDTLHLHSVHQRSESLMCELIPSVIFRWGKKKRQKFACENTRERFWPGVWPPSFPSEIIRTWSISSSFMTLNNIWFWSPDKQG